MNGLQYANSILANHSESQTNWALKSMRAAPPPPVSSPPLAHPMSSLSGAAGCFWWIVIGWAMKVKREVSKLRLTKVWFLVSEALKCGSVKEKLLRKNDTSLGILSACSTPMSSSYGSEWIPRGNLSLFLQLSHKAQATRGHDWLPKQNPRLFFFFLNWNKKFFWCVI